MTNVCEKLLAEFSGSYIEKWRVFPTFNKRMAESSRLAKPLSPEAGPGTGTTPITHARWNFT